MKVRELITVFGIKPDPAGVNQVNAGLGQIAGMAKQAIGVLAGLAAVRWVQNIVEQVAETGQAFDRLSERTGIATADLQKLGYAAKMYDAELSDITGGLRKLQIAQVDAASGSASGADKFKKLGVSVKNADGTLKSTTDLFYDVADGISQLKTDAEKTSATIDIFGRGASALVPMFKKGSVEIKKMSAELEEFGALMDQDLVDATAKLEEQQKRLDTAMMGVKISIAKKMIPEISRVKEKMLLWWKENGKIIRQKIERVAERIAQSFGRVARGVERVVRFVGKFWQNLNPLSKKILIVTGLLIGFMKILSMGKIARFATAFGILVLLFEDFNGWLEGSKSLLGAVLAKLKEWTGLDFDKGLRGFIKALKELSESPKPFDWGAYWKEVASVADEYLNSAAQTRKSWWIDLMSWFEKTAKSNPITKFLYDLESVFFKVVKNAFQQFRDLQNFIIDIFTKGVGTAFSNLAQRIKEFFKPLIDTANWLLNKIPIFRQINEEKQKKALVKTGSEKSVVPQAVRNFTPAAPSYFENPVLPTSGQSTSANSYYGGTTINAPLTLKNEIHAAPGMDENALATKVSDKIRDHIAKQNRTVLKNMTPARAQ